MKGLGRTLGSVAVAALAGVQPGFAQDDAGGLKLTFGLTQRLEASSNTALSTPSSGRLASSVTQLSFRLSSETRTQALNLSLSGNLRFEDGAAAEKVDGLADPALALSYRRIGVNSSLLLQASADRSLLSRALATSEDPDPIGAGTRLRHSLGATLDLGIEGPLGLALDARHSGVDFDGSSEPNSETRSLSATGTFRFASGATSRVTLSQANHAEDDALQQKRETLDLALGWSQPIAPNLTLDVSLGRQQVDTYFLGALADRTEGLTGTAGLQLEMARGSAGLELSQVNEPGATRQTFKVQQVLDFGSQNLSLSLGATRRDAETPIAIGGLDWRYEGDASTLSLAVEKSVSSGGLGVEVTTDRLALGLSRELGPNDRVNLNLSAARIDDSSAALVNRLDVSASYSRDFGQDWQFNLGAAMTERSEGGAAAVQSSTIFLSVTKTFEARP